MGKQYGFWEFCDEHIFAIVIIVFVICAAVVKIMTGADL